jgi:hypothetical protein
MRVCTRGGRVGVSKEGVFLFPWRVMKGNPTGGVKPEKEVSSGAQNLVFGPQMAQMTRMTQRGSLKNL